MALDPQAQAFLDREAGRVNAGTKALDGRVKVPPPQVADVRDTTIAGPETQVLLRIYTPIGVGPFPVTLWLHGGGWVQGTIADNDATCRHLTTESGSIVVAVDYRLAPGTKFPGASEDCYAAMIWVVGNAESFGGDPTRVAIAGASAGGNLAAAVTLMSKDREGPLLAHQLMVYPVTDQGMATESYDLFRKGFRLTAAMMQDYQDAYLRNEADKLNPYAAPILYDDLSGLPPAHIITAGNDVLRDEGEAYAEALAAAGVEVQYTRARGQIHTSIPAVGVMLSGAGTRAEMARALRRFSAAGVPA